MDDYASNATRLDDVFYLSLDAHPSSWAASLTDDDEGMSEAEVVDYIKDNKPDLFKKLHNLPLRSFDIPLGFHGQRTLQRLSRLTARGATNAKAPSVPTTGHSHREVVKVPDLEAEGFRQETREEIEERVYKGHHLREHDLPPYVDHPPCSYLFCREQTVRSEATQVYYSLECDVTDINNDCTTRSEIYKYYCAKCFDDIFDDRRLYRSGDHFYDRAAETQDQLLLDGIDQQTVLNTAERLYPRITPRKINHKRLVNTEGAGHQPYDYPSNSSTAKALRAHKQHEIHELLTEVSRYEKTVTSRTIPDDLPSRCSSPDASVLITRPVYMETMTDRYKKQGLREYDRKKYLRTQRQEEEADKAKSSPVNARTQEISGLERFCYCRDFDDETEVLRCSAAQCTIGWFHFRCTGPDRLPTIGERFLCYYCSNNVQGFVTKASSDEDDLETPLQSPSLQQQNVHYDYGHEAEYATDRDEEAHEEDGVNTAYAWDNSKQEGLQEKISRWTAINSSGPNTPNPAHTNSILSHDTAQAQADSSHGDESSNSPITLPTKYPSKTTDSTSRQTTSSLPSFHTNNTATNLDAPRTPPSQPTYKSSKPWGTPINVITPALNRLPLTSSPLSPSPATKRKFSQITQDTEELKNQRGLEMAGSEDEDEDGEDEVGTGIVVPFIPEG
ncbi:hypothetical protein LTR64_006770 [Lithohypha guttulata]|uniref:uncharacterized protein n=1 Tax=Lithohypha guttulata TaxID=1690604 RepID=UPI002DDE1460|nr:hypothetical protein LTR51_004672 [Lithohypha guttulata]